MVDVFFVALQVGSAISATATLSGEDINEILRRMSFGGTFCQGSSATLDDTILLRVQRIIGALLIGIFLLVGLLTFSVTLPPLFRVGGSSLRCVRFLPIGVRCCPAPSPFR